MIEIGHGGSERGHPFFRLNILAKKNMLPKANDAKEKEDDLPDLSPKKNSERFDEN